MSTYCLLCLLSLMTPPEPPAPKPGDLDLHGAVMHLVKQSRRAATASRPEDDPHDLLRIYMGLDLTTAREKLR